MADRFNRKAVLVAGGTGGLGRAASLAFLKGGANVHVTFRSDDEFSALKKSAGEYADSLRGYRTDVTSEKETAELVQRIGPLDLMVNAVGAYARGQPLWETDLAVLEQMMSLNLRSGFVRSRSTVPDMLKRGSGAIVNVSSRSAVDHAAGASAYTASKAAALQ